MTLVGYDSDSEEGQPAVPAVQKEEEEDKDGDNEKDNGDEDDAPSNGEELSDDDGFASSDDCTEKIGKPKGLPSATQTFRALGEEGQVFNRNFAEAARERELQRAAATTRTRAGPASLEAGVRVTTALAVGANGDTGLDAVARLGGVARAVRKEWHEETQAAEAKMLAAERATFGPTPPTAAEVQLKRKALEAMQDDKITSRGKAKLAGNAGSSGAPSGTSSGKPGPASTRVAPVVLPHWSTAPR